MTYKHAIVDRNLAAELKQFQELPILREDDPEWDMGEADVHAITEHILRYGIAAHLADRPRYRVFSNLNLHYQRRFPSVYISPDVMVAKPNHPEQEEFPSYHVLKDGPVPEAVAEVLSAKTAEEGDLGGKLWIYAMLGVAEYLLVDASGTWLPERLLLKRLRSNRTWMDERDADGGVTSQLGFRVVFDTDGQLRVLNAVTGKRYPRPAEAYMEAEARRVAEEKSRQAEEKAKQAEAKARQAEERIRVLESELQELRGRRSSKSQAKSEPKRRKKS
jgi:hypothetical protein